MNRRTRMLARFAALSVLIGLGVMPGAQPASANYSSLQTDLWAYTDSHEAKKSFVKPDGDIPLGTRIDADNETHTSRFYFTIDITSLRGTAVHMATLVAREKTVVDCKASITTELWRTTEITDQTSWNNPPSELEQLGSRGTPHTWQCPSGMGFDVLRAVNAALARHDPKITFELRVTGADETDPDKFRTFTSRPYLSTQTNIPPTVSDPALMNSNGTCGKINEPTAVRSGIGLSAKAADADHTSYLSGQFAIWPVEHADQRTVLGGGGYLSDGIGNWNVDLSRYADGTLLAWTARSYDQQDYSDWTKPCYLRVDRTAPKNAPSVASKTYMKSDVIQSGGAGVPGDFLFDANGDRDVVAFRYEFSFDGYSQWVDATHPGGSATITYTPKWSGPETLTVAPIDAAGNAGPETSYEFRVAWTAPGVDIDLGGVGLPSKITMYTTLANATDFGYQIEDGKEVKFPVVNGSGSTALTFTHKGYFSVQARTYDHNTLLGATTYQVNVSDAPIVSSEHFQLYKTVVLGDQGSFTFQPRTTNIVAYQYRFDWNGDWQRVDAQSDGTAVLNWTADRAGFLDMEIESIQADGTVSDETQYMFDVIDPHPTVWVDLQSWPPMDGVGLPVSVEFTSWMPNVIGYAYTLNGGSEQTVSGGPYTRTDVVPDRPGDNTIVAQAIYADGSRSPATTYTFQITDAPIVSWNGADTMIPGDTATFTVRPALSGVTSYKYAFDSWWPDDATHTAEANSDGTLSLPWVITSPGYHRLEIASVSADGTTSDFRLFQFTVIDPRVDVYGFYNQYARRGGIGVPGWMTFSTQIWKQVVSFVYQVNGGPEITVVKPADGPTSVTITPDRNGTNTLTVKALMSDGRYSPTTTYTFLVGTAPYVNSMDYPSSVWSGGAGVSGTFIFSGGTAGIVAFDYQINGTSTEVAADASGTAAIHWTPAAWGTYTMYVRGKLADGTLTDQTTYYVYVQP